MMYFQVGQEVKHVIYPQLIGRVVWNGLDEAGKATTKIQTPSGKEFTFRSESLAANGLSASAVFQ